MIHCGHCIFIGIRRAKVRVKYHHKDIVKLALAKIVLISNHGNMASRSGDTSNIMPCVGCNCTMLTAHSSDESRKRSSNKVPPVNNARRRCLQVRIPFFYAPRCDCALLASVVSYPLHLKTINGFQSRSSGLHRAFAGHTCFHGDLTASAQITAILPITRSWR
jgi:hypothetical protein